MEPTHQLARAAAVFQSQFYDIPSSDEYRAARSLLTSHRYEIPGAEDDNLLEHAANVMAAYILSQAEQNPMPSLFERFGK